MVSKKRMRAQAKGVGFGPKDVQAKLKANREKAKALVVKVPRTDTKAAKARELTGGYCLCGCGAGLMPKRLFAQGHDARVKGWLLSVERGQLAITDLPERVQKHAAGMRKCSCCGVPVWLGQSECEKGRCNCAARAEVTKKSAKAVVPAGAQAKDETKQEGAK